LAPGASACAEFIADIFLCPLEAVRIRSVSDASFPKVRGRQQHIVVTQFSNFKSNTSQGLGAGAARMLQTDGVLGFYAGLGDSSRLFQRDCFWQSLAE
jgi:solute carrier family 25 phosphate transporter 3